MEEELVDKMRLNKFVGWVITSNTCVTGLFDKDPKMSEEQRKLQDELSHKLLLKWKDESPETLREAISSFYYPDMLNNMFSSDF